MGSCTAVADPREVVSDSVSVSDLGTTHDTTDPVIYSGRIMSCISPVTPCSQFINTSTSALEMNSVNSSVISCSVSFNIDAPQVIVFDAAQHVKFVIISETRKAKNDFHIDCYLSGHKCTVKVAAMVDSGATALFMDHKYTDHHNMWKTPLDNPISLYNIDGSLNEAGSITHKIRLKVKVGNESHEHDFFVMSLGPEKVILGLPWLCM